MSEYYTNDGNTTKFQHPDLCSACNMFVKKDGKYCQRCFEIKNIERIEKPSLCVTALLVLVYAFGISCVGIGIVTILKTVFGE